MNKIYLVERSKGVDIQIYQEELSKVIEGIKTGKMIVVNQGIINPKYISGIVLDEKNMEVFSEIELENIFDGIEENFILTGTEKKLLK